MQIVMGWPEYIMSAIVIAHVFDKMARATGWRPKNDTPNGAYAAGVFLYPVTQFGLLYWGGFFS